MMSCRFIDERLVSSAAAGITPDKSDVTYPSSHPRLPPSVVYRIARPFLSFARRFFTLLQRCSSERSVERAGNTTLSISE